MKPVNTIKSLLEPVVISLVFFFFFYSTYSFTKTSSVAAFSILVVIAVSWRNGLTAGFILTVLNSLWISATIIFKAPEIPPPPIHNTLIGIFAHTMCVFVAANIGNLARKLRLEIEERKKVEALLTQHREELEQRVEERTRELDAARLKLHQAEKMETIGQLTGGIAHDFKNHLTIILGFSNLLLKKLQPDSPEATFAKQILTSSERASELTTQLMNFARKERYKPQPIEINDLIKETASLLSRSIAAGISISCTTASELPEILGGKSQIQNAILNLALNARDAMPNGGQLTIATHLVDATEEYCSDHSLHCKSGTFVGITVADTGFGIDPEVKQHLFEPFFTTKGEGKGTGMGLATIQGMTRQHQGDIFVVSEPGNGAAFTMLFPITHNQQN